jgi:hypothetical protein
MATKPIRPPACSRAGEVTLARAYRRGSAQTARPKVDGANCPSSAWLAGYQAKMGQKPMTAASGAGIISRSSATGRTLTTPSSRATAVGGASQRRPRRPEHALRPLLRLLPRDAPRRVARRARHMPRLRQRPLASPCPGHRRLNEPVQDSVRAQGGTVVHPVAVAGCVHGRGLQADRAERHRICHLAPADPEHRRRLAAPLATLVARAALRGGQGAIRKRLRHGRRTRTRRLGIGSGSDAVVRDGISNGLRQTVS